MVKGVAAKTPVGVPEIVPLVVLKIRPVVPGSKGEMAYVVPEPGLSDVM